jgi:hypothetical protein
VTEEQRELQINQRAKGLSTSITSKTQARERTHKHTHTYTQSLVKNTAFAGLAETTHRRVLFGVRVVKRLPEECRTFQRLTSIADSYFKVQNPA